MKRTFKTIISILLVSMLFVSCNADMKDMGIFNTIKHSKPSTNYKLIKVAGAFPADNLFIIETEDGIQTIAPDSETRNTLVSGLHASMKFVNENKIYYTVKVEGESDTQLRRADINADKTATENPAAIKVYIEDGKEIAAIENSFYENGKYILKARDVDGVYHFISDVTPVAESADSYTFSKASSHEVKDTKTAPVYIGSNHYYVYNSDLKEYNIYDFAGTKLVIDETTKFTKTPLALENNYLFLSDGTIYKVDGSKATDTKIKHTITYLQTNQDIPMTTHDGKIYGVFGAKPFVFDGTEFKEHGYIGEVSVIDLIRMNDRFYAISANSGIFVSDDGITYKDAKLKDAKSF